VVLATSIAETSITIEGVRVVIDSGLARVPRFEPDAGVTRLETVRVSRGAADQRRGRAGRTEPGVCYRLWEEPQTQSLPAFAEPEIRSADLAALLLDCAEWGTADPRSLSWIDPPSVSERNTFTSVSGQQRSSASHVGRPLAGRESGAQVVRGASKEPPTAIAAPRGSR
jgi:HrpA-like RNA helicase